MSSFDDNECMTRVRSGDVRMLALLFERYHRQLFQFFLHLTGSRELSEDLVQEVFLRLLKYRHTYQPSLQFVSWMYQIARNTHVDYLRKKKGNATVPIDDPNESHAEPVSTAPLPEERMRRKQEVGLLQRALAALPEEKREILILSRYQELKYDEIARILQIEVNTVKVRVFRAVKELSACYRALTGEKAS